ncbi:hypothetical protein DFH05DRAFT_1528585 [Lentinula detonsa]|uniref:UBC core domain-containing protein n=1 Tax=Lentinula detonsa TaxID=2804962 RepID=A0A9W8NU46_9AGAR|nr:hypothetical protein DFH05DRAFT_1528585 [Lentinula detonsa]
MSSGEIIEIFDSDSEPESLQIKRQKTDHLSMGPANMSSGSSPAAALAGRNANLKGRRRFVADLNDLQAACKQGFVAHGLVLQSVRAGDDEGTLEAMIKTSNGEHPLNVNILLSDTADYPKTHNYFSYSPDSHVAANILSVIEGIVSFPSRPIAETMDKFLANLTQAMNTGSVNSEPEDDEDDEEEDYIVLSDDDVYTSSASRNLMNMARLQHDFLQIVAREYRPGLIRFSGDNLCISVSLSVIKLAETVPPRALNAWDRLLLSKTQYLVLLISGFRSLYPPSASDATKLKFHVGLSGLYKPSKEHAREACRNFGLITNDAEDELRLAREKAAAEAAMMNDCEMDETEDANPDMKPQEEEAEEEEDVPDRFDKFSLSGSLDSLMNHRFAKLVNMRRKYGLGWAGAELLFSEMERNQKPEEEVLTRTLGLLRLEDGAEREMIRRNTTILPDDPLYRMGENDEINWPLTAFCYLIRRLTLCTRYCIVCHNKLETDYVALKPYVCNSKLCSYQYYSLNHGPSLEYEIIHNPETVDLLVSITHAAAAENVLDEPLPIGMGLRVPPPDTPKDIPSPIYAASSVTGRTTAGVTMMNNGAVAPVAPSLQPQTQTQPVGFDGLYDFDELGLQQMRASVMQLLDSLPPVGVISDMKKHLERKVKPGNSKPKLTTMPEAADVVPAAWKLLRWCVGSCTAYLEEISFQEESIVNTNWCFIRLDSTWKQYRFSVGAPDAEAKFKAAVEESKTKSQNAKEYPSLYAFHGSPLRNWHSIIRNGLWFKSITHGRAYGHGVYLAKDGLISMGSYAAGSRVTGWRNSKVCPSNCVAIVELVNLPSEFVSSNPHFVVDKTHWLVVRYLLVKSNTAKEGEEKPKSVPTKPKQSRRQTPYVKLDPAHPMTLGTSHIQIPEPTYQLESILRTRRAEAVEDEPDNEDKAVFEYVEEPDNEDRAVFEYAKSSDQRVNGVTAKGKGRAEEPMVIDDDDFSEDEIHFEDYTPHKSASHQIQISSTIIPSATFTHTTFARQQPTGPKFDKNRPADDWIHDPEYVRAAISKLMPPPEMSTPGATMAVQKELKALLKEQRSCNNFKELGWYMPEDFMGDNLFQWIVELHSFDVMLPIAKDLKAKKLNSVIFEIRFPPDYPLSPPFFRIITPRFLPFIQGGGGHVTGGGSICMDLLTASGWLPSYKHIKLAISNPDPRPARLAPNWNIPYGVLEALQGYKRAAATHNWIVPIGLEKLMR